MVVQCSTCRSHFDDEFRWTSCPHKAFAANDGKNNFAYHEESYISKNVGSRPLRVVEKLWGTEIWHHNDEKYCMKTLMLNAGYQSSIHYHAIKAETFLVTGGVVQLEIADRVVVLESGESVDILPGTCHRFRSLTISAIVIEASTEHSDEDVFRIEEAKECPNPLHQSLQDSKTEK